jgi:hypothetical protein
MTLYDVVGIIGVSFVLISYLLLQIDRIEPKSISYSLLNLLGAFLILISLYFTFNLASFIIEIAWLLISAYGLIKAIRLRLSS